jgi:LemA protein
MPISKLLPHRISKWLAVMGAALVLAGCGVNAIPTKDEAVKAAFGNVQAAYQRRADLIPNLVATVQGYAAQEKSVLTAVTQARASATHVSVDASTITDPAQFEKFQQAQNQLSGVLGRLMAISEQYPDLKSNANFLALQSQLEGTENRIEIARRDYNAAVQDYNTTLVTIPGSLWAATMYRSYKPATLFQASAAAQSAPVVNFNTGGGAAPAQQPATQPANP